MKYVNDDPIDFTDTDWKKHSPFRKTGIGVPEIQEETLSGERRGKSILRLIVEWAILILIAILFAYVIVYLFGQQRTNVGQSMVPTLSGGDIVLINTLAYQVSSPSRGDIISFKLGNSSSSAVYIKRIIGLPGETVQIIDGMIYIDEQVYLEGESFPLISSPGIASEPVSLGNGEYFVLGDNRNNSEDSRNKEIGIVTSDMIEGKVWFILSPAERRTLL